jgi:hypothetical protein
MATTEDYYEELGKFGHLGQSYSLNVIKELKEANKIVGDLKAQIKKASVKFDELMNGGNGHFGLDEMIEGYYRGCMDEEISELEKILTI